MVTRLPKQGHALAAQWTGQAPTGTVQAKAGHLVTLAVPILPTHEAPADHQDPTHFLDTAQEPGSLGRLE